MSTDTPDRPNHALTEEQEACQMLMLIGIAESQAKAAAAALSPEDKAALLQYLRKPAARHHAQKAWEQYAASLKATVETVDVEVDIAGAEDTED